MRWTTLIDRPTSRISVPLISARVPRIARLQRRASLQLRIGRIRRRTGLVKRSISGGLVRPMLIVVVCVDGARYRHERQKNRNRGISLTWSGSIIVGSAFLCASNDEFGANRAAVTGS